MSGKLMAVPAAFQRHPLRKKQYALQHSFL
jgi:hypothetical protein